MPARMNPMAMAVSIEKTKFAPVIFAAEIESGLAEIAANGFDAVEFSVRDSASADWESIRQLLKRHSLRVSGIATGQTYVTDGLSLCAADAGVREAAVQRMYAHAQRAAEFGAVLIAGGVRGKYEGDESHKAEGYRWLLESLVKVAGYAKNLGVKVVLETLNRYEANLINRVEEGLAAIAETGCDNLELLLDTFHLNIEESDLAEAYRAAQGCLGYVHLADSNRWSPGSGHVPYPEIFAELRRQGYTGPISCEILPLPSSAEATRNSAAYLGKLGML